MKVTGRAEGARLPGASTRGMVLSLGAADTRAGGGASHRLTSFPPSARRRVNHPRPLGRASGLRGSDREGNTQGRGGNAKEEMGDNDGV